MNLQPLLEQAFAASRSKDYLTAWTLIRRYWRLRDAGANAPPGGDRRAFGVADVSNYHHYNVHGSY